MAKQCTFRHPVTGDTCIASFKEPYLGIRNQDKDYLMDERLIGRGVLGENAATLYLIDQGVPERFIKWEAA